MSIGQEKYTTVLDSRSTKPIAVIKHTPKGTTHNTILDSDVTPEEIERISPEGTPAQPLLSSAGLLILILGSLGVVLVLSIAAFIIWGFAVGALTLVFGAAIAWFGNPVVWSGSLRAIERHELETRHNS